MAVIYQICQFFKTADKLAHAQGVETVYSTVRRTWVEKQVGGVFMRIQRCHTRPLYMTNTVYTSLHCYCCYVFFFMLLSRGEGGVGVKGTGAGVGVGERGGGGGW